MPVAAAIASKRARRPAAAVCVDPVGRVVGAVSGARRADRSHRGRAGRTRACCARRSRRARARGPEGIVGDARARSGPTRAAAARRVPRTLPARHGGGRSSPKAGSPAGAGRAAGRAASRRPRPRRPPPAHRARRARAGSLRASVRLEEPRCRPAAPRTQGRDLVHRPVPGAGELEYGVGAVRPAHEPDEGQQPAAELGAGFELPALAHLRLELG